jgi:hypothetical protein
MTHRDECTWLSDECEPSDGLWIGSCPWCKVRMLACDYHAGLHIAFAAKSPLCPSCNALNPSDYAND